MEQQIGTSLAELFDELADIHRSLGAGLSTLAVLGKGADSPEMAEALGLVWEYMQSPYDDLGILARVGRRAAGSMDLTDCC